MEVFKSHNSYMLLVVRLLRSLIQDWKSKLKRREARKESKIGEIHEHQSVTELHKKKIAPQCVLVGL